MLDANGVITQLNLVDAQAITLAKAALAGVEVVTGSVEDQINNWLAQVYTEWDAALYAVNAKMYNPTGSDIDLQNPGTPRKTASHSTGYLKLDNSLGATPVTVTAGSIFTAPNSNTYTTGTNTKVVGAGAIGYIAVSSVGTGKTQNLPAGQTFTTGYALTVTNPQPFADAIDAETDAQYLSRIIYLRTNNTSAQSTPAATQELLDYYAAARIYVNNSRSNYITPVPIPLSGYNAVVLVPSSTTAGAEEIQSAINILASRFEFGNSIATTEATALHPVLSATVYTGTFPQTYAFAPAQAVQSTIAATVTVSFPAGTDSAEKSILAEGFATNFVQNLIDFFGGAAGAFHLSFQEAGSPLPAAVTSTPAVLAGGTVSIAPVVSIEQVRAFISDQNESVPGINYLACTALTAELDPLQAGQSAVTMSILAPAGGTVASIDFVNDALFTDSTSWFDRYIFLDPNLITVTVNEA